MNPENKIISACLIGDPPAERFHSMGIYEAGLAGGLSGLSGIEPRRHQWPEVGNGSRNRYIQAIQTYWNRHRRYPALLRPAPADIYHILDHSYAHLLSRLPPERTVVTCHDLMPLMVDGYQRSPGGKLSQASFRHSIGHMKKARHIIADSAATKKAIVDILGLPGQSITVVPLGVDEIFLSSPNDTQGENQEGLKFILQVGATAEPYKNTMNALKAFFLLLKGREGRIKLLKVGKPYTREQQMYIESHGIAAHLQYSGFVPRADLPRVYRKASVLLMPSLYEGFGLPVLEAMACGVPVVTSDRGSIPEVAGDAVLFIDPTDPENIAEGMEKVLTDKNKRSALIAKGRLRAKDFTWERTARETVTVYQKIIERI